MYLISDVSDHPVLHRKPAPGMMSTLMYGICILLGQFTAKDELWKTVRQSALFSLAPYALVVLVSFYRTDCWQNADPTSLAYALCTLPWPQLDHQCFPDLQHSQECQHHWLDIHNGSQSNCTTAHSLSAQHLPL